MKKIMQMDWKEWGEVLLEILLEVAILALYTWCAKILWDSVIVDLSGLSTITYWQALQLLVFIDVCASFPRRLRK